MNYRVLLLVALCSLPARADYILNPNDPLQLSVGGYFRLFSGKVESLKYNSAIKTEPYAKLSYKVSDDLTVSGKVAYRVVWDDRFSTVNKHKIYDAYASISSKTYGTLDAGNLKNVAYILHQGPKDVGLLDIEDTDLYMFFPTPKGFYAPVLTHIYTDARDTKLSYTTPDLNGFTWAMTVVQSEDKKADSIAPSVKIDHGKGVITAVRYLQDLKWLTLGMSGAVAYYHDDRFFFKTQEMTANHSELSTGLSLMKNGFTFGAAYRRIMFPDKLEMKDTQAWSTGLAYEQDPYGISLSYFQSKTEYLIKNTRHYVMLSGRYNINKYVRAVTSIGHMEFDTNQGDDCNGYFAIAGLEFKL